MPVLKKSFRNLDLAHSEFVFAFSGFDPLHWKGKKILI
jgi:hypothetical protein